MHTYKYSGYKYSFFMQDVPMLTKYKNDFKLTISLLKLKYENNEFV